MSQTTFRPSKRYLVRLYFSSSPAAMVALIMGFIFLFASTIGQEDVSAIPFFAIGGFMLLIQMFFWISATLYYNSIVYQIKPDSIVVHSGILTHSVIHIPLRQVTNIEISRDLVDQILGIGSMLVHTAGTGDVEPEVTLAGIHELDVVYTIIARYLQRSPS